MTEVGKPASPERVWRAIQDAKVKNYEEGGAHDPGDVDYVRVDRSIAHRGAQADDEAKLLAGGHSLLPAMNLRSATPRRSSTSGASYCRTSARTATAWRSGPYPPPRPGGIGRAPTARPIVSSVAGQVGDPQVRHMGTIGGSVAHADPAGDIPAVLLASAPRSWRPGRRDPEIAAAEFFPGLFQSALATTRC